MLYLVDKDNPLRVDIDDIFSLVTPELDFFTRIFELNDNWKSAVEQWLVKTNCLCQGKNMILLLEGDVSCSEIKTIINMLKPYEIEGICSEKYSAEVSGHMGVSVLVTATDP